MTTEMTQNAEPSAAPLLRHRWFAAVMPTFERSGAWAEVGAHSAKTLFHIAEWSLIISAVRALNMHVESAVLYLFEVILIGALFVYIACETWTLQMTVFRVMDRRWKIAMNIAITLLFGIVVTISTRMIFLAFMGMSPISGP